MDADIAEAVFRYQFTHNASGQGTGATVCFLDLGGSDPDDAFMRRFAGHRPPFKKGSACRTDGAGVVDKVTGEKGLILRVGRIVVTGRQKAVVEGGYHEGVLSASENTYTLRLKNGRWQVVEDVMGSIS